MKESFSAVRLAAALISSAVLTFYFASPELLQGFVGNDAGGKNGIGVGMSQGIGGKGGMGAGMFQEGGSKEGGKGDMSVGGEEKGNGMASGGEKGEGMGFGSGKGKGKGKEMTSEGEGLGKGLGKKKGKDKGKGLGKEKGEGEENGLGLEKGQGKKKGLLKKKESDESGLDGYGGVFDFSKPAKKALKKKGKGEVSEEISEQESGEPEELGSKKKGVDPLTKGKGKKKGLKKTAPVGEGQASEPVSGDSTVPADEI